MPVAPACIASRIWLCIAAISPSVAGFDRSGTQFMRSVLWPTRVATLSAGGVLRRRWWNSAMVPNLVSSLLTNQSCLSMPGRV